MSASALSLFVVSKMCPEQSVFPYTCIREQIVPVLRLLLPLYFVIYRTFLAGVSVWACLTALDVLLSGVTKETGVAPLPLADFGKTGAGIIIDESVSMIAPLGMGNRIPSSVLGRIVGNVSYAIEL